MSYAYGLTDLSGVPIGRIHWATERKLTLPLNGLPTVQFKLRWDDSLAQELLTRLGDCLVKVYLDSTLVFIGDVMDIEAVGPGGFFHWIIDRKGMVNQGYVLPSGFEAGVSTGSSVASASDFPSITARGCYQEVLPGDMQAAQFRQAWAEANVRIRKVPRQQITFDPSANTDDPGSLMVNAAGPLWRLSKRLIGTPYPDGVSSYSDVRADLIFMGNASSILNQQNLTHDTGIREGTSDDLYVTSAGQEPSWAFKPASEALTELQDAQVPYPVYAPPTALHVGRDDFSAANATLSGTTPDVGTAWTEWGSTAGSYSVGVNPGSETTAIRNVNADAGTNGRFGIIGMADADDVAVRVDWQASYASNTSTQPLYLGVVARYDPNGGGSNIDEWIRAGISYDTIPAGGAWVVQKKVGGTVTQLATVPLGDAGYFADYTVAWYSMALQVDALGNWVFWHWDRAVGFDQTPVAGGNDVDLKTGGALALGKCGIWDMYTNASGAITRYYDNFTVASYTGPQSFDFELAPIEPTAAVPPKIADLNIAYQIGTTKPAAIFAPGKSPEFGADYEVGDFVTGRIGDEEFQFRVYGVEISIDDEGRETVVPKLVDD